MAPPVEPTTGDRTATLENEQHFDVLVVGSINTDLVVPVPTLPQAGETVLGGDLRHISGGKGANQAVAAARLGARTALLGCVGADEFGRARLQDLRFHGVTVGGEPICPTLPTGAALILVDEAGDNVIAVAPGANVGLKPSHIAAAAKLFQQSRVLVCQLEVPLDTVSAALEQAHEHGRTTILNAAPGTVEAASLLEATDVLVVNQAEAASLLGHPVKSIAEAKAAAAELCGALRDGLVLTLGAEGSILASCDGVLHVPAWRVPTVDATAAGDSFVGALAAALAHGEELATAARYATAAAAITVGRFGAQPSLPTGEEVAAFLQDPPVAECAEDCHDRVSGKS